MVIGVIGVIGQWRVAGNHTFRHECSRHLSNHRSQLAADRRSLANRTQGRRTIVMPCPVRRLPDFHRLGMPARIRGRHLARAPHRENPHPACFLREMAWSNCTKSGHPPVDGVHSIENKSDRGAHFSLTAELEGVQQNRSLTVS